MVDPKNTNTISTHTEGHLLILTYHLLTTPSTLIYGIHNDTGTNGSRGGLEEYYEEHSRWQVLTAKASQYGMLRVRGLQRSYPSN